MCALNTKAAPDARPPTVLFIDTSAYAVGGTPHAIRNAAVGLHESRISTRVLIPPSINGQDLVALFSDAGVDVQIAEELRLSRRNLVYHTSRISKIIRESGATVVNVHSPGNHIPLTEVAAGRMAGKRVVVSVHHATAFESKQRSRKSVAISHLTHGIIVGTEVMRTILLNAGVPPQKLHLVRYGIPAPEQYPSQQEARRRLKIPQDGFVVGTLARLVPNKGIADLLAVTADITDMSLLIGGEGPERECLERQANSTGILKRVAFLGKVKTTQDLYAASDVFALPSYAEGFGLVYVEAAMHGIPSIGTRVGGVPEAISDGESGLLITPGNRQELYSAIQAVKNDSSLRRTLGCAARERAHTQYTISAMATGYRNAFQLP